MPDQNDAARPGGRRGDLADQRVLLGESGLPVGTAIAVARDIDPLSTTMDGVEAADDSVGKRERRGRR